MGSAITRLRHRRALIDHILDEPQLVAQVRALEPRVLTKLIHHVGLEDSGDLIALATTEQLEQVFDEDLWKSDRPGQDETFDADRFALWLAVLVEQGARFAAERVAQLDEDLVTLALSRHIFVIDIEQLAQQMSSSDRSDDDEQLEKQLENGLYQELEQYRVISRNADTWDPILSILVELNTHDFAALTRILERCCDISTEYIEDNGGLYEVLSAGEMVEADVAGEREDRREQLGYVPPSSALAFLKLAIASEIDAMLREREPDPITRAHLRAAPFGSSAPNKKAKQAGVATARSTAMTDATSLTRVLEAANVIGHEKSTKALPAGATPRAALLSAAMRALHEHAPELHMQRSLELLYLANVLLAGCGTRERRLRPAEAAEAALATTSLGAEHVMGGSKATDAQAKKLAERLRETTLVTLFRVGFHLLCGQQVPNAVGQDPVLRELRALLEHQGLARA